LPLSRFGVIGWDGHVVLARRLERLRFWRIDVISPRNQVHVFRIHQPDEVDGEVKRSMTPTQSASSATSRGAARSSFRLGQLSEL
jgi:hypothetical protein